MEKINIAELLKDCPKGMELDCAMYENVEFDYIEQSPESIYPIHCLMKINGGYNTLVFTSEGCNDRHHNAKCVIFPKGKTTWEGFQRPFKDGDIVISKWNDIHLLRTANSSYCAYREREQKKLDTTISTNVSVVRLATEEEKQKLFDAIKTNGYKWNTKTKTLEKLIEPKFKVGNKIRHKTYIRQVNAVTDITDTHYILDDELALPFTSQDGYELVPNKFDITTLKPFDRVLTRVTPDGVWGNDFFGYYKDGWFYCSGHIATHYCIPYESNEHLLGTTNDCDEYFKTWK